MEGLPLVVSDLDAARAELVRRGVEVSEPYHSNPTGRSRGPDPQRTDYNSFVIFYLITHAPLVPGGSARQRSARRRWRSQPSLCPWYVHLLMDRLIESSLREMRRGWA